MMRRLIRWLVDKYLDDALVEAWCKGYARGLDHAYYPLDLKVGGTDD